MSSNETAVAGAAGASLWSPTPDDIAEAHVTSLIRRFDVADFDALYRFSIESPGDY